MSIKLDNLSFQIGTKCILSNISLSLEENTFALFVGPNGGGKTTLMKLIMGLYKPSSGSIQKISPDSFGYVPQSLLFDPMFPISLLEFVLMGALSELPWYGFWTKKSKQNAYQALENVHLANLAKEPFSSLSGGQQKRACLARALMTYPKVLILDEPTSGLDNTSTKELLETLQNLKNKFTILMVSHTLPFILPWIDTIFCVNKTVESLDKKNLCQHISMGVYHPPKDGESS